MVMAPQFWKYTKNQWVVYLIKKLKKQKQKNPSVNITDWLE